MALHGVCIQQCPDTEFRHPNVFQEQSHLRTVNTTDGHRARRICDLSHLTSSYVPSWYTIMCMLVDVGLGLYTAARIPACRRASAVPASVSGTPQAASQ